MGSPDVLSDASKLRVLRDTPPDASQALALVLLMSD